MSTATQTREPRQDSTQDGLDHHSVPPTSAEEVLARLEALRPVFAEHAEAVDRARRIRTENYPLLFDAGAFSLIIAREDGGLGGGLLGAVKAIISIAQGDPATALSLGMFYVQHTQLARRGQVWPPVLIERLTQDALKKVSLVNAAFVEPVLGSASHGAVPHTSARLVEGRWVLNGHKRYVTGARHLSWIRVMGVTEEEEPRVGHFLVPASSAGVEVLDTWDTLGMRGTESNDIVFKDVSLSYDSFFGGRTIGEGLREDPAERIGYLLVLGSVYHGVAQASREATVKFAKEFEPGALGAPVATLPRFQDAVGDIDILQSVSRRLLLSIAADYDATPREDSAAFRSLSRDANIAQFTAIRNSIEVTSQALELAGNRGVTRSAPFERYHRDTLSARAHNPQAHLTRSKLGKEALGVSLATPLRPGVARAT
jgi:alkylation response protein AidB-like acyl-CoA dehydrogenase